MEVTVASTGKLGSEGDEAVPASPEFVHEFREWLSRRYSANDILTGWALNDRAVESLDVAARLVPMWRRQSPTGQAWFIDPEGGQIYRVDPRRSHFWADLAQFRGDSARSRDGCRSRSSHRNYQDKFRSRILSGRM